MNIGIVATHAYPIPTPNHGGDIVILDLALALDEMGHRVTLYAPDGTTRPPHGRQLHMPCTHGQAPPFAPELEMACWKMHADELRKEDVIHDFSIAKTITEMLYVEGKRNLISTPLGGMWLHPDPPLNIVCWSKAMRERGLRGATDYDGSPTPDLAGPPVRPIRDAKVVYGGIDTSWYTPSYPAGREFFLWMNRWHRAKGYHVAIELAKKTGINLVIAGESPNPQTPKGHTVCMKEAVDLASGCKNIKFAWMPPDPFHHEYKRELYRRAIAYLYPVQFQEPFGLSQVEAMACGTPVVGVSYGSVPEVVEDGVTGFVRGNDVDELAKCLPMVSELRPERCREEAVRRFDRKVMAEAYFRLYEQVLRGEGWGL